MTDKNLNTLKLTFIIPEKDFENSMFKIKHKYFLRLTCNERYPIINLKSKYLYKILISGLNFNACFNIELL